MWVWNWSNYIVCVELIWSRCVWIEVCGCWLAQSVFGGYICRTWCDLGNSFFRPRCCPDRVDSGQWSRHDWFEAWYVERRCSVVVIQAYWFVSGSCAGLCIWSSRVQHPPRFWSPWWPTKLGLRGDIVMFPVGVGLHSSYLLGTLVLVIGACLHKPVRSILKH